jgi:hypothetical protein
MIVAPTVGRVTIPLLQIATVVALKSVSQFVQTSVALVSVKLLSAADALARRTVVLPEPEIVTSSPICGVLAGFQLFGSDQLRPSPPPVHERGTAWDAKGHPKPAQRSIVKIRRIMPRFMFGPYLDKIVANDFTLSNYA